MHAHDALAQSLAALDLPLFGVVGDANAYLVDRFACTHGGRYTAAANENGAVLMALGAAMIGNTVGLATVTHGPALTNCVTALAEAAKSNTPLVLLAGDTKRPDRENLQNIDQRQVVLAAGAGFEEMRSAATALEDLGRALRRAQSERRPVVFNMPADLLWEDCAAGVLHSQIPPLAPTTIGEAELNEAIGMIAAARRPLILVGRGAVDAKDDILALARRLEAPLATTMRAKNLFADTDYALGVCGTVSTPQAGDVIAGADCIIAFGASLNFHTTAHGGFTRDKRVIQICDRAQDLAAHGPVDLAIWGEAGGVARTLHHWLDEAEIAPSGFTPTLPARGLDRPVITPAKGHRAGTVDFLPALARLDAVLPQNRNLVTDAGRWMVRSYGLLTAPHPRDHVTTASFGSIGLGMGAAIGAAVARPDRPTVLFCGDGGFMLGNITEFNAAVRARCDLICVVFNDGSYGAEHIQLVEKQIDPAISLFDWPELVPLATALGGTGMVIASEDDLARLPDVLATRDRQKPFLIDVKLDPHHVTMW